MSKKTKWIPSAMKSPDALRAKLGVKKSKTLPGVTLKKAAHSKNPSLRKRVKPVKRHG